jgi:hypothetical protein
MRLVCIALCSVLTCGCVEGSDVPSSAASRPPAIGEEGPEVFARLSLDDPSIQVKEYPLGVHPAAGAEDAASCRRLGGEWDSGYILGTLIIREPMAGASPVGEMCWTVPRALPDAGKSCGSEYECIGNCLLMRSPDGKSMRPQCQASEDMIEVCNNPLYYDGGYHWYQCPVP